MGRNPNKTSCQTVLVYSVKQIMYFENEILPTQLVLILVSAAQLSDAISVLSELLPSTHSKATIIAKSSTVYTNKWSVVLILICTLWCELKTEAPVHPVSGSFDPSVKTIILPE